MSGAIIGGITALIGAAADGAATVIEASQVRKIRQIEADNARLRSGLATAQKTIEALSHDLDVRSGVIVDLRRGKSDAEARANGLAAVVNDLTLRLARYEAPPVPDVDYIYEGTVVEGEPEREGNDD